MKKISVWEKLKQKHPYLYCAFNILIILLPIGTYVIRPYVDYYFSPNSQLEHNLAGDPWFIGHVSSYNLWIDNRSTNLTVGIRSIIDVQIQNKYDIPLLTSYEVNNIDGLNILNISLNRQTNDNPVSIVSSEWHHFYLDVYVNESAKLGKNEFCFRVKETLKDRSNNYEKECVDIIISHKPTTGQQQSEEMMP
ncbi:MAG: hypothetical protein WC613_05760 [Candidatus Aenigmatarchaeota archaeon]